MIACSQASKYLPGKIGVELALKTMMKWIFAFWLCCTLTLPAAQTLAFPAKKSSPPLPIVTWDELKQQLGGPSLVTLKFKDTPALEAIEALGRQAPVGVQALNRSEWEQREPKTVTGDYRAQPLWEVTLDLSQKLGANLLNSNNWGTGVGITFYPWHREKAALTSQSGLAIFALSDVYLDRVVPQGEEKAAPMAGLRFSGYLYLDPKLRLLDDATILHIEQALDDNGQSLAPAIDQMLSSKTFPIDLRFNLQPPARRSARLQLLRGTLHTAVAFQTQTWQIKDVLNAKNASTTFETGTSETGDRQMRLDLREVKKEGNAYQIVIDITPGGSTSEQQRTLSTGKTLWFSDTFDARLFDASAHEWKPMGGYTQYSGGATTHAYTMTLNFEPAQQFEATDDAIGNAPFTVVLNYRSDWRELIVPFSFENLPLP